MTKPIEQWKEIATQSEIVRKELNKLIRISRGIPLRIMIHPAECVRRIDLFRAEAEKRMLKDYPSSTDIFKGEIKNLKTLKQEEKEHRARAKKIRKKKGK